MEFQSHKYITNKKNYNCHHDKYKITLGLENKIKKVRGHKES